ncbi:MAG: hypothetical protein CVV42_07195 [Candidatus Riflebacteria bacterium HGW-Riflebacteria-2]|nr:MAG: hypothetical protein CVV42_07195 [Candidatus Riflebacteria bacterium HGW-Riflebacteria-2]
MTDEHKAEVKPQLFKINLDMLLWQLWLHRSMLMKYAILSGLLAVIISLFFTSLYTAEIAFLPVGSKQLGVFLKSRSTAMLVLEALPEVKPLLHPKIPTSENYANELSQCLTIKHAATQDYPFMLKVELGNATMAANVANTYMNLVASFVNSPEFDMAQRNTRFIQGQYDFYAAGLRKAEDALRSFQEQHGIILLDSQTAATVGLVAQIEARLIKKEIELQALQSAPENPVAKKRANEIAALKDTLTELKGEQEGLIIAGGANAGDSRTGINHGLAEAPRLRLEHRRLSREVSLAEQTCMYLQSQLTSARIQQEKEGVSFMIIDAAIVPDRPSHPKRWLFALLGALIGFLLATLKILYYNGRQCLTDLEIK